MTDRPPFTAEQLDWLKANLPPGPANRILNGITPSTDAQRVGAYALLSAEQRAQLDADNAKAAAQVKVSTATAQVTQVAQAVQEAVSGAAGTGVDVSVLEQVAAAVQPILDQAQATPAAPVSEPEPATDVPAADPAPVEAPVA